MEKIHKLEQVIRTYIPLPPIPTGNQWFPVVCNVCHDHGKKGPRAGFHFDGDIVKYHCFNCGHSATDDPDRNKIVSEKMTTVLQAFHVPREAWQAIELERLGKKTAKDTKTHISNIEPDGLTVPKSFYYLKDAESKDKWAEIAKYTLEDRKISFDEYPFMLSTEENEKWFKRLIIPIYKDSNVIFYQGRDLTGKAKQKYVNPSVSREKILFGYDKLFNVKNKFLYIVEGFFDAFCIDGVAIFGNQISKGQTIWLNKSHKQKVYIPDRLGNGQLGANQAIKLGWSVSTPNIGDCKDINDAVCKYGKLYVLSEITSNITSGFEAKTRVGLYCK